MDLADDLAAAATVFEGQGYTVFIRARELLKEELNRLITSK